MKIWRSRKKRRSKMGSAGDVVVVVNEWGGFPSALSGNVCSSQSSWAKDNEDSVIIPFTERGKCMRALLSSGEGELGVSANILMAARRQGWRTIFLGAREGISQREEKGEKGFPLDPRLSLDENGVDECSLFDTSHFTGLAEACDDEVLGRACVEVEEASDRLLLWVNLLGYKDVFLSDFDTHTYKKGCRTIPKESVSPHDAARTPSCVAKRMSGLRSASEDENGKRRATRQEDEEKEYLTLMDMSWGVLQRREGKIAALAAAVEKKGGRVAYTSSSSFMIGEKGMRGSHFPTVQCCTTFWCSNTAPNMHGRVAHSLDAKVTNFISEACNVPLPFDEGRRFCVCWEGEALWGRVNGVEGRAYSCVAEKRGDGDAPPLLTHMFEEVDVEEIENVLPHIQHLLPSLKSKVPFECTLERRQPLLRASLEKASEPSLQQSVSLSTLRQSDTPSVSQHVPKASRKIVPSSTEKRTFPSVEDMREVPKEGNRETQRREGTKRVKEIEKRLNNMHR